MAMSLTWSNQEEEVADSMRPEDRIKYDRGYSWSPNPAPVKQEDIPGYLFDELTKLSNALNQLARMNVPLEPRLPDKPVEGTMVVIPNGLGTNQLKIYLNNTWVLIA